jgi:hypothetical protein
LVILYEKDILRSLPVILPTGVLLPGFTVGLPSKDRL